MHLKRGLETPESVKERNLPKGGNALASQPRPRPCPYFRLGSSTCPSGYDRPCNRNSPGLYQHPGSPIRNPVAGCAFIRGFPWGRPRRSHISPAGSSLQLSSICSLRPTEARNEESAGLCRSRSISPSARTEPSPAMAGAGHCDTESCPPGPIGTRNAPGMELRCGSISGWAPATSKYLYLVRGYLSSGIPLGASPPDPSLDPQKIRSAANRIQLLAFVVSRPRAARRESVTLLE